MPRTPGIGIGRPVSFSVGLMQASGAVSTSPTGKASSSLAAQTDVAPRRANWQQRCPATRSMPPPWLSKKWLTVRMRKGARLPPIGRTDSPHHQPNQVRQRSSLPLPPRVPSEDGRVLKSAKSECALNFNRAPSSKANRVQQAAGEPRKSFPAPCRELAQVSCQTRHSQSVPRSDRSPIVGTQVIEVRQPLIELREIPFARNPRKHRTSEVFMKTRTRHGEEELPARFQNPAHLSDYRL